MRSEQWETVYGALKLSLFPFYGLFCDFFPPTACLVMSCGLFAGYNCICYTTWCEAEASRVTCYLVLFPFWPWHFLSPPLPVLWLHLANNSLALNLAFRKCGIRWQIVYEITKNISIGKGTIKLTIYRKA